MSKALRFLLLVAIQVSFVSSAAAEGLPRAVAQALRAAGIPERSVAAVVQEVGAPRPSLSVNGEEPMNPASVMKLVTTFVALEALGPAYRWKTEAYAAGSQFDDTLQGHLILKGYGDPKLTLESFWLMLRNLRERGLRHLQGDLVLDRTHFDTPAHDPAQFDAEPLRPYNVGPDALLVNFKAVRFQFLPDPERGTVRITAEPRPPGLEVLNALRLSNGACAGDWRERLRGEFRPSDAGLRAVFAGTLAESCGERQWNVALFSHPAYVAGVFRELWEGLGGSWTGTVHEGPVPGGARLLYAQQSPTLAEVVRDINKFSNNVMARQLYLTLAAEKAGPPARAEASLGIVRAWLARKGLHFPELVIENGSGLSRIERISATSLTQLLLAAWRSPVMPELVASLPVAAVDGTLRRRLHGDPMAGQAHLKTGSLSDVRAVAGYVLDRSGRRQAVVMLVNHPNAAQSQTAIETLLRWTYER